METENPQNNLSPIKSTQDSVVNNHLKPKNIAIIVIIAGFFLASIVYFLSGGVSKSNKETNNQINLSGSAPIVYQPELAKVDFVTQKINISKDISNDFSISEIQNIHDIEKAYGFTFNQNELKSFEDNKFVIKNILDTNLGNSVALENNTSREFVALYQKIFGNSDYKERKQANSVFITSDSMLNLFSILSVELLKETENKYLFAQVYDITSSLYAQSSGKLKTNLSEEERREWIKIRNYFAVPYAILSTSQKPVNANDYWNSEDAKVGRPLEEVMSGFESKDKNIDTYENVSTFVKNLNLDKDSQVQVLADIKAVYDASESKLPEIFKPEYQKISDKIKLKVPFGLFKPRGTYTSSSLRRQYFRGIQWYQQIPFLLASKDLTNYALQIGNLVSKDENILKEYKSFSSLIAYIVGESDDYDISDYSKAVENVGYDKSRNDNTALVKYLNQIKAGPKIKSMPAEYSTVGDVKIDEVVNLTKGMRFVSQKFIPDSYWTGRLTQGDEAPAVNGERLPDMASSLEIMSIMGSPYATSHFSDLEFYKEYSKAIDARLLELKNEKNAWSEDYWRSNLYTNSMWTFAGIFDWLEKNRQSVPKFMQSKMWDAKNLLTASGFWTELRHTSILYAKQSFAEKGGGGGDSCDTRKVPPPAKGYIEPQPDTYDRLYYTAKRLSGEYKARNLDLQNIQNLDNYISLLDIIREYTKLELENTKFEEKIGNAKRFSYEENKDCIENQILEGSKVHRESGGWDPASRWEEIRIHIIQRMAGSLPSPVEGPILPIKDRRAAVVADIHTGKQSQVLEEGTGVPRVIFVAVKDVNGPRLTVGFTYSHYEKISSGDRWTDEQWQDNFYTDSGNDLITYKPKNSWPDNNKWLQELLGIK